MNPKFLFLILVGSAFISTAGGNWGTSVDWSLGSPLRFDRVRMVP